MIKNKIALIQITRIGDVIQTCIAARQLKLEQPNIELVLITRTQFASGLSFLTNDIFDDVIYLNIKDYFKTKSDNLDQVLSQFDANFFDVIEKHRFDAVINLSFSTSSSYLTRLIKSQNKLGPTRNDKSQVVINDLWSQFVYSNVQNGKHNVYNLVDIFRFMLGSHEISFQGNNDSEEKNISIHPFASQKKKMWGTSRWTEFIYKFLKENEEYSVNIIGSKDDEQSINNIITSNSLKSFVSRLKPVIGTALENVYETINNSQLLICHDSMASHLAAIKTVPTIVISLGVVRPNETTPYSNNVLNLVPKRNCFPCDIQTKCDLLPCHKDINHQLVARLSKAILNGEELNHEFLKKEVSPFFLDSVDIYTPSFENGFMTLFKLNESNVSSTQMMENYYRIIWSYFFKEKEVETSIPFLTEEVKKDLFNNREGVKYLFELINFGLKFSNSIVNESSKPEIDYQVLNDYVSKLGEIDKLLTLTKNTYPQLQPVVDYFYVAKANVAGRNIKEISENSLLLYYSLNNMCKVLYDLITSTLKDEGAQLES